MKKTYTFQAQVWLHPGESGAWHFLSVPEDITKEINFYFSEAKHGWGSLPVKATIGKTNWKTSIFPDKKTGTYLLPLKSEVRKKENILEGSTVSLRLELGSD